MDRQPPDLAAPYPSLVPQVDGLGNELGGVRGVELRVPLATYLPWNLRGPDAPGSPEELSDFIGAWIPLSPDDSTRAARGDSRPSIRTLYPTRAAYLNRVRLAAGEMAEQGFLLAGDVATVVMRAEAMWDWIHVQEGRTARRGPPNVPNR